MYISKLEYNGQDWGWQIHPFIDKKEDLREKTTEATRTIQVIKDYELGGQEKPRTIYNNIGGCYLETEQIVSLITALVKALELTGNAYDIESLVRPADYFERIEAEEWARWESEAQS